MTRIAALIVATAIAAAPATAANYSAKPVTAPSAATIIGKNIAWQCSGDSCRGSTETSRPLVICQDLARRAGRIESFAADGKALDSGELEKCNSRAATTTALAHAE
jgi:hypothetical protein